MFVHYAVLNFLAYELRNKHWAQLSIIHNWVRDPPIMLIVSPYILRCCTPKFHLYVQINAKYLPIIICLIVLNAYALLCMLGYQLQINTVLAERMRSKYRHMHNNFLFVQERRLIYSNRAVSVMIVRVINSCISYSKRVL